MVLLVLCVAAGAVYAQMPKRTDAIWARTVPAATITLDGMMNEAAWAQAESVKVQYGKNAGMPGSGWRPEAGTGTVTDPTDATVKFLVSGNKLYVGVFCKDSSIGGGLFNEFDGFLMNIRDKSKGAPAPPFEIFYGWVAEPWADTATAFKGALPGYFGALGGPRDSAKKAVWDAKTTVNGITNSDTTADVSWTSEFEFNLTPRGYDVTTVDGDIVQFSISIYDADFEWPKTAGRWYGNRAFWQCPWGNTNAYNHVRVFAKPGVTTSSGAPPVIPAEVVIPDAKNLATPVIDGNLNETAWSSAAKLDIRFGDNALRATYPGSMPLRSGQFQPTIDTVKAVVLDPADGTLKYFFKGDTLYVGMDVRDQNVWGKELFDLYDGFRFTINDRAAFDQNDSSMLSRDLLVRLDSLGHAVLGGYLPYLKDSLGGARVAVTLKAGTTVGNSADVDAGFQVEMALNLRTLGYPAGRGDGVVFFGATLFDGDVFPNPNDTYGNRVWFGREGVGNDGPTWAYMDPNVVLTGVDDAGALPRTFELLGNYPNPFNPSTTIRYSLPEASMVTLEVYDVLGRQVATQQLGVMQPGLQQASFSAFNLSSGMYVYRLQMTSTANAALRATLQSKMMLVK
jgi:hypothetical protein